jgi:hypothetical protein
VIEFPKSIVSYNLCLARLIFGEHNGEMQKTRPIPAIFSGNGESRSFCLEQYVPFAKTYIHPTHDILFFSNEDEKKFWLYYPSFYHIPDHPLDRVRSVAIEVEYETLKDFGGHLHWLRGLGSPQELIICLAPSFQTSVLLADHYLRTFGTRRVMDSSNRAQLVRWPGDIDQELVHRVRTRLIQALQEEKNTFPDFRVPVVRGELYFAYFDPEYWV